MTFITGDSVLKFLALLSRVFLTLIVIQLTSCHTIRDLGLENLGIDYKHFHIFLLYFYVALSWIPFFANFIDDIY